MISIMGSEIRILTEQDADRFTASQVVTAREDSNDATTAMGSDAVPAEAVKPSRHDMKTHQPTAATAPADQDGKQTVSAVWAPLLSAGLKLVQALTAAPSGNGSGVAQSPASPWIETDTQTGRTYLKLPMPEPQVVREVGEALSRLVSSLANRSE
jgi:hypothetical protein